MQQSSAKPVLSAPLSSPFSTLELLEEVDCSILKKLNKQQQQRTAKAHLATSPPLRASRSAASLATPARRARPGTASSLPNVPALALSEAKRGMNPQVAGVASLTRPSSQQSRVRRPAVGFQESSDRTFGAEAAAAQDRSPTRSPEWSPRRTSRLQGTTLTTALSFVDRDLALQRAASGPNVSTAEAWLEDILELISVDGGDSIGSDPVHGLTRAKISRQQLLADGLDSAQAAQLYQCLFVHSFGAHQAIEELLRPCGPMSRASVGVKFVRALVAIFERLVRTSIHSELVEMLHGMEDEVANVQADSERRLQSAKLTESQLNHAVATAVRRAEAATTMEALSIVHTSASLTELALLDKQMEDLSAALKNAQAAEAEARESLAHAKFEMMLSKSAQSKEEQQRAEREARKVGQLVGKLAQAQETVLGLELKLKKALREHEREHEDAVEAQRVMQAAKRRELNMERERDESRDAAMAAEVRLSKQLAESRRIQTRTEEEARLMNVELAVHEAGWRSSARLARTATEVATMYELVMPQEMAHMEECAVEATARERREGQRALRAATIRAGVERRALEADLSELELTTEALQWEVNETRTLNKNFRGVVEKRAIRLQNELGGELVRSRTLAAGLQEADEAYWQLWSSARTDHGTWTAEMHELEMDVHNARDRIAGLTREVVHERERFHNANVELQREHDEQMLQAASIAADAVERAKCCHAVQMSCVRAELAACEAHEDVMRSAVNLQGERHVQHLKTLFFHREVDRAISERRQSDFAMRIASLEQDLLLRDAELLSSKASVDDLQNQLAVSEAKRANAAGDAQERADSLEAELTQIRERAEHAKVRAHTLESDLDVRTRELQVMMNGRATDALALSASLQEVEAEAAADTLAWMEEIRSAREHAASSEANLAVELAGLTEQLRAAISKSETHAVIFTSEIKTMEAGLAETKRALSVVQETGGKAANDLKASIDAEAATRALAEQQAQTLTSARIDCDQRLVAAEERARMAEELMRQLRAEKEGADPALTGLEVRLEEVNGTLAKARVLLDVKGSELADMLGKLRTAESLLESLTAELAKVRVRLDTEATAAAAAAEAAATAAEATATAVAAVVEVKRKATDANNALKQDLQSMSAMLEQQAASLETERKVAAAEKEASEENVRLERQKTTAALQAAEAADARSTETQAALEAASEAAACAKEEAATAQKQVAEVQQKIAEQAAAAEQVATAAAATQAAAVKAATEEMAAARNAAEEAMAATAAAAEQASLVLKSKGYQEARLADLKRRQANGELTAEESVELAKLESQLSGEQETASEPRIPPGGSVRSDGVIVDADGNPVLGEDGKPMMAADTGIPAVGGVENVITVGSEEYDALVAAAAAGDPAAIAALAALQDGHGHQTSAEQAAAGGTDAAAGGVIASESPTASQGIPAVDTELAAAELAAAILQQQELAATVLQQQEAMAKRSSYKEMSAAIKTYGSSQLEVATVTTTLGGDLQALEHEVLDLRAAGVGIICVASDLSASETDVREMEKRAELAEDAARDASREASRIQELLDECLPELEEWRRKFETRVDASTVSEGVMAKALHSEQLVSPLGDVEVHHDNILPEELLSRLVSEIYTENSLVNKVMEEGEPTGKSLTEFVEQKYLRKFGIKKIADENMHWLIGSIRLWKKPNKKIYNFGRFCGMYNELSTETMLFYELFVGVAKQNHGKDFSAEWLGSEKARFHVTPETAMRSVNVVFQFLPAERMQQVSFRVTQLMAEVKTKKGVENLIDFDALSDLVIDEHKTETTRNFRYLEAVFNAADVDGDGVLTFDEFAEMVRRVEPNLNPQRTSALFAECLKQSGSDGIRPDAFADCAIRNGLLKTKASGKPTAKLAAKESVKVLRDLFKATKTQLEADIEPADRLKLKAVVDELAALLADKKPNDDKIDRAWMLYQHLTAELAVAGAKKRIGERTSHGGIITSDVQHDVNHEKAKGEE